MSLADLDVAFIIGSPRSGTTWLQNMLGSHDEIAALPEAFIFSHYVRSLELEFERVGMANSREAFERGVSLFVEEMYRVFLERKPTARMVTDKTPEHALFAERIENYVPRAKFIHLLRDGRDSVASMLRGKSWAPSWKMNTAEAAATWGTHVAAAREPRRHRYWRFGTKSSSGRAGRRCSKRSSPSAVSPPTRSRRRRSTSASASRVRVRRP